LQINLDPACADCRKAVLEIMRAFVRAARASEARFKGEPIETPPLPPVGSEVPATSDTLTAALEGWKRQRERSPGTATEYERAVQLFTELYGDLPVAQIKRNHARQFREALQNVPRKRMGKLLQATLPELSEWGKQHPDEQKIGAGTVNKLLGGVQAVCRWPRFFIPSVIRSQTHYA
jgi:hypothetical protein